MYYIRQWTTPWRKVDGKRTRLVVVSDIEFYVHDLSLGVRGQRVPLTVGGAVPEDLVAIVVDFLRGPEQTGAGETDAISSSSRSGFSKTYIAGA